MTTRAQAALACAVLLALAAAPRAARASAADAFEKKVKPVSGQLYTKAGKLELTVPSAGISLNDAFFSKYAVGAKLGYHFNEYWSLSVSGALAATSPTGSTQVCRGGVEGCTAARSDQLNQVPGEIKWIGGAEVAFAPIYGKLNVFAEKAIHFDLAVMAGADLIAYRDVVSPSQADPVTGALPSPGTVTAPGGHLGLGARVFLARSVALRLAVRDYGYSVAHLSKGNFQTQLLAEAGLSFFIPVARQDSP